MIQAEQIGKSFGNRKVLKNLNFTLEKGEVVALLGLNGTGKTTLIRVLSNLLKPDCGEVSVDGISMSQQAEDARGRLGVMLHNSMLYGNLTCRENLQFYARLYALENPSMRVDSLLEFIGLSDRQDDKVGTFSRGMQQRVSLARALLHNPDYLFLDEVFTGLDQRFLSKLSDLLKQKADEHKGILLTTHDLDKVFEVATRVDILHGGGLIWSNKTSELTSLTLREEYRDLTASTQPSGSKGQGS